MRIVGGFQLLCVAALIAMLGVGPRAKLQTQPSWSDRGPGGPILVITAAANSFTHYYAEILRAEGLNSFAVADISSVSLDTLKAFDIVILGETPLNPEQVVMLTEWVNAGGKLIATHPDKKLAPLLGLADAASTMKDDFLLVDTSKGPGAGIVNQTIQFHGTADLYRPMDTTSVAMLYSDATTSTPYPAVTLRSVGHNSGQAAAFTYDLARSIVYTRQGNPSWSRQRRDGMAWSRSDDLFWGAASYDPRPDWVDPSKIAIPQADEQQRLLANLVLTMTMDKQPLPRFWYFPNGKKAIIIMTGDDHGNGGTRGRFDSFMAASPPGCSVAHWECIRATSYIYPNTPLSNDQAAAYSTAGFEIALHLRTNPSDWWPTAIDLNYSRSNKAWRMGLHGCADWTPATLEYFYSTQLTRWSKGYASLPSPSTIRSHCVVWSDYTSQPRVELEHGIRLDTNYYYYPGTWVKDKPGLFTGSGIPMRFADQYGNVIDVYQAPTQMSDEAQQSYPYTVNTLLDDALGPQGFYGAFTVNAHTDNPKSAVSDAVIASAVARSIPVVSARQMLHWLDGRNSSSFDSLAWDGRTLRFTVKVSAGAISLLEAMVPANPAGAMVSGVALDGSPISYHRETIKGIEYALFRAAPGAYTVEYSANKNARLKRGAQ
jgi:hypothetical protein